MQLLPDRPRDRRLGKRGGSVDDEMRQLRKLPLASAGTRGWSSGTPPSPCDPGVTRGFGFLFLSFCRLLDRLLICADTNMVKVFVRHGTVSGVEFSISTRGAEDLLATVAISRHFGPCGSLEVSMEDGAAIVSTAHELTEGMELTWYPVGTAPAPSAAGRAAGLPVCSGFLSIFP